MNIELIKQLPEWSEVKHGKRVLIVKFPNCPFKWMPTYKQLEEIKTALQEIENESWNADN